MLILCHWSKGNAGVTKHVQQRKLGIETNVYELRIIEHRNVIDFVFVNE